MRSTVLLAAALPLVAAVPLGQEPGSDALRPRQFFGSGGGGDVMQSMPNQQGGSLTDASAGLSDGSQPGMTGGNENLPSSQSNGFGQQGFPMQGSTQGSPSVDPPATTLQPPNAEPVDHPTRIFSGQSQSVNQNGEPTTRVNVFSNSPDNVEASAFEQDENGNTRPMDAQPGNGQDGNLGSGDFQPWGTGAGLDPNGDDSSFTPLNRPSRNIKISQTRPNDISAQNQGADAQGSNPSTQAQAAPAPPTQPGQDQTTQDSNSGVSSSDQNTQRPNSGDSSAAQDTQNPSSGTPSSDQTDQVPGSEDSSPSEDGTDLRFGDSSDQDANTIPGASDQQPEQSPSQSQSQPQAPETSAADAPQVIYVISPDYRNYWQQNQDKISFAPPTGGPPPSGTSSGGDLNGGGTSPGGGAGGPSGGGPSGGGPSGGDSPGEGSSGDDDNKSDDNDDDKSDPDDESSPDDPSLSKDAKASLNATNRYRSKHGAKALKWSKKLEKDAQAWADRCVFEHGGANGAGQNLMMGSAGYEAYKGKSSLVLAVDGFYSEVDKYPATGAPNQGDFHLWGHFTQLVWKGTSKMACVKNQKKCPDGGTLVVYHYEKAGNDGNYVPNVQARPSK